MIQSCSVARALLRQLTRNVRLMRAIDTVRQEKDERYNRDDGRERTRNDSQFEDRTRGKMQS
jgi:hypothetical protein